MKKLIKNGKIVTPEKIIEGDILVEEGKIKKIGSINIIVNNIIDAKGKYILPGLIEVHGHLREPGFENKEDIPHGTRAAAAGGFTSIIDMPNTKPPTVTVNLLKDKINKIYPERSFIDYAFFIGTASDKLDELKKVNPSDIAGVKVFMAGHETTPTTIPDDRTLAKIISICADRNLLLAVHAEDQWLINYYNSEFKKAKRSDAALWSEIRPTSVVTSAAARTIALISSHKNFRLYILHMSTPEEFALVAAAKDRGMNVFGELVSYQLSFNINDYKKYGNKIKVAPALRSPGDQKMLWQLLHDGNLDVLCSEHTPHEWETKNQPDMWKAQAGTPDIQEAMPSVITGWSKRFGKDSLELGLQRIAEHASKKPAEIFGLKGKGEMKIGNDADFSIIDTKNYWKVKKSDLFSKCGWSAYEGMKLLGRPFMTFLRGELVYNNGKIVSKAKGKWINH
ncbi:dihydroorotase family protein [Candidatus Roizmanbacteria bacterium]|nr:dihydroorotase family protein [Candidatus Roizmanbacteria bacterium]